MVFRFVLEFGAMMNILTPVVRRGRERVEEGKRGNFDFAPVKFSLEATHDSDDEVIYGAHSASGQEIDISEGARAFRLRDKYSLL